MATGAFTDRREIRPLTSLRGIAALYVVIYHFHSFFGTAADPERWTPFFSHGARAVDLFFILSGFILAETTPKLDSTPAYARFLWRRLARIYPLHLFMLGAFVVVEVAKPFVGVTGFPESRSQASLLANLLLVQAWGFFSDLTWNIPSWSVSAEFAAYLAFPLLLLPRRRAGDALFVIPLLLLVAVLGPGHTDTPPLGAVPHALALIAIGVGLHPVAARWPGWNGLADGLLFAALLLMGMALQFDWPSAAFIICAVATVVAGSRADKRVAIFLGSPVLHWLGVISYSIYLVHYFMLDLWTRFFAWRLPLNDAPWLGAACFAALLLLTLAVAQFTYRRIELPARRSLNRLGDRIGWRSRASAVIDTLN
jgi:peptidoglycan/LPS O-acetylase OafA/YrhL